VIQKKFAGIALAGAVALGASFWPSSRAPRIDDVATAADVPVHRVRAVDAPKPLPLESNPQIDKYVAKYTGPGLKTTIKGFERARTMRAYAEKVFKEEGVPPELVWLAQVESTWHSQAVSPAAAAGVWQFIPKTAVRFGLQADADKDLRYDYKLQTRVAARYLRFLYDYYDGNWPLAIGAYNTGEDNMDRAIERAGGVRDFWKLSQAGVLHPETAEYVPKVLAASIVGTHPERYGLGDYLQRSR
jgi:membrane-bound lytic murein transglycosylase D